MASPKTLALNQKHQKLLAKNQPKEIKGYKQNDFHNRAARRRFSKKNGMFKYVGAWKQSTKQLKNVQTYHRPLVEKK